jgi:hypothetical protein
MLDGSPDEDTRTSSAVAHYRWALVVLCGLSMPTPHLVHSYQPLYHKTWVRFQPTMPTYAGISHRQPSISTASMTRMHPLQSSPSHPSDVQDIRPLWNHLHNNNHRTISSSSTNENQNHTLSSTSTRLFMTTQEQITLTISTMVLLGALASLILISGQGAWRFYLAGGLCAAISHGITTPIDVVKVRRTHSDYLHHT